MQTSALRSMKIRKCAAARGGEGGGGGGGGNELSKHGLLFARQQLLKQYLVSQARLNDQAAPLLLCISGRVAGPSARAPARSQSAGPRNTETCRRSLYLVVHSAYRFSKANCAAGRLRLCSSHGLAEFKLQGMASMLKRHKNRSVRAYSEDNPNYWGISTKQLVVAGS